jgi:hypothetical protein
MLLCPKTAHKPAEESKQQALRAYCLNIYTVPIAGRWAPPKMGSASKIPSASVFPIINGT